MKNTNIQVKEEYEICEKVESVEEANMHAYYRDCYYYEDKDTKKIHLIPQKHIKSLISFLYRNDRILEIEDLLNSKKFLDSFDPDKSVSISERFPVEAYLKLLIFAIRNKRTVSDTFRSLLYEPILNEINKLSSLTYANKEKIERALYHLKNTKSRKAKDAPKEEYSLNYYYSYTPEFMRLIPKAIEIILRDTLKKKGIPEEDINKLFEETYLQKELYFDEESNEELWGEMFDIYITYEKKRFFIVGRVIYNLLLKKLDEYAEKERYLSAEENKKIVNQIIPESILDLDFIKIDGAYDGEFAFLTGLLELFRFSLTIDKNGDILVEGIPVNDPKFVNKLLEKDEYQADKNEKLDMLLQFIDKDIDRAKEILLESAHYKLLPKFKRWLYEILYSSISGSQVITYVYPADLALIAKYLKSKRITKDVITSINLGTSGEKNE